MPREFGALVEYTLELVAVVAAGYLGIRLMWEAVKRESRQKSTPPKTPKVNSQLNEASIPVNLSASQNAIIALTPSKPIEQKIISDSVEPTKFEEAYQRAMNRSQT